MGGGVLLYLMLTMAGGTFMVTGVSIFCGFIGELGLFMLMGNIVEELDGVVTLELELSLESRRVLFDF